MPLVTLDDIRALNPDEIFHLGQKPGIREIITEAQKLSSEASNIYCEDPKFSRIDPNHELTRKLQALRDKIIPALRDNIQDLDPQLDYFDLQNLIDQIVLSTLPGGNGPNYLSDLIIVGTVTDQRLSQRSGYDQWHNGVNLHAVTFVGCEISGGIISNFGSINLVDTSISDTNFEPGPDSPNHSHIKGRARFKGESRISNCDIDLEGEISSGGKLGLRVKGGRLKSHENKGNLIVNTDLGSHDLYLSGDLRGIKLFGDGRYHITNSDGQTDIRHANFNGTRPANCVKREFVSLIADADVRETIFGL